MHGCQPQADASLCAQPWWPGQPLPGASLTLRSGPYAACRTSTAALSVSVALPP